MPRVRQRLTGNKLPADFAELVRMHPPRAIRDEADYDNTQEVVDLLTSIPRLTKGQSEYLETLSVLMEAYEAAHHLIDTPDLAPLEALKFLMGEAGLTVNDVGQIIGSQSAASM